MIPWDDLPAADMIREGLADLAARRESVASYLVQIGSLKMRRCGIEVAVSDEDALDADHRLYALLGREHGTMLTGATIRCYANSSVSSVRSSHGMNACKKRVKSA